MIVSVTVARPGVGQAPGQPLVPGFVGPSAYDLAVAQGFAGTLEEWLASLHAEPVGYTEAETDAAIAQAVATVRGGADAAGDTLGKIAARIASLSASDIAGLDARIEQEAFNASIVSAIVFG